MKFLRLKTVEGEEIAIRKDLITHFKKYKDVTEITWSDREYMWKVVVKVSVNDMMANMNEE